MTREFSAALRDFEALDVRGRATDLFQEAAAAASEAVVVGLQDFGPGAPMDTGFLRASFRVARNAPEDGPSERPETPGRKPGDAPLYPEMLTVAGMDLSAAQSAMLGETVYCTTIAEYATYLEEGGMVRRHGPPENVGATTQFIAPVEARWDAIVDDAAQRVGYGR